MYLILSLLFLGTVILLQHNQPFISGWIGEYRVNRTLNSLGDSFLILDDLLLPKEDGNTSQIDHVVLTTKGIFVIETKNYDAKIYGNEFHKQWKCYYKGNKMYKLHNPIHQNYGHIKTLERILSSYGELPFYNIVVFTNRASLNVTSKTPVILVKDLSRTIKKLYLQEEIALTEDNIRNIKHRLEILNNNTYENEKKHIHRVRQLK